MGTHSRGGMRICHDLSNCVEVLCVDRSPGSTCSEALNWWVPSDVDVHECLCVCPYGFGSAGSCGYLEKVRLSVTFSFNEA